MKEKIPTSKVRLTVNYELLASRYRFFKISLEQGVFYNAPAFVDAISSIKNIESVSFEPREAACYVMSNTSALKQDLRKVVDENSKRSFAETIKVEEVEAKNKEQLPEYNLIRLLLNSLSTSYCVEEPVIISNTTGRLLYHSYVFPPIEITKKERDVLKETAAKEKVEIPTRPTFFALDISVSNNSVISLGVVSYTHILLANCIEFKKHKKSYEYPRYDFSDTYGIRKIAPAKGVGYIKRKMRFASNNIVNYMNIESFDKFKGGKPGVLAEVLSDFNSKFEGIISLELQNGDTFYAINSEASTKRNESLNKAYFNLLSKAPLNIVARNDYYKSFAEYIKYAFEDALNTLERNMKTPLPSKSITISDDVNEKALNIILTRKPEFFIENKIKDDYMAYDGILSQHVIVDDYIELFDNKYNKYLKELKPEMETLSKDAFIKEIILNPKKTKTAKKTYNFPLLSFAYINQLCVKSDLANKTITLDDWSKYGFNDDVIFSKLYYKGDAKEEIALDKRRNRATILSKVRKTIEINPEEVEECDKEDIIRYINKYKGKTDEEIMEAVTEDYFLKGEREIPLEERDAIIRFVTVKPDGTLAFSKKKRDIMAADDNIFGEIDENEIFSADTKEERIEGVISYVIDGKKVHAAIRKTDIRIFPELASIRNAFWQKKINKDKQESLSRNKKTKEEMLDSVLDVKSFLFDNNYYYEVGAIGYGMNVSIARNPSVKRVEFFEEQDKESFHPFLHMMNTYFVRFRQNTAYPYPFKYLDAYEEMETRK